MEAQHLIHSGAGKATAGMPNKFQIRFRILLGSN